LSRDRVVLAGALFSFGGVWSLLSILIAESLTPGYDVSTEAVSGLGLPYFSGICNIRADCLTPVQPAADVFVSSLFLGGALLLLNGYLLSKATGHRLFALGVGMLGVGELFVGSSYLPIYLGATASGEVGVAYGFHVVGALIAFVLGATVAIAAYRLIKGPFRYFGVVLGTVALAAFVLFATGNGLGLGLGGMERMIIYPINLWSICFGAYLMGGAGLTPIAPAPP